MTVMAITGIDIPTGLGGTRMTSDPAPDNSERRARDRLQKLVDYDLASHEVHSLVPPFFNTFAYGQLVIYLLVLLVWKGKIGGPDTRRRVLGVVRVVAVAAASVPASTFLANLLPWWRFPVPMLSIVGAVGLFVALIAFAALRGPWGRAALGPARLRRGRDDGGARRRRHHRLAAPAVLAHGAAARGRRALLRHGQRDLRPLRHLVDPARDGRVELPRQGRAGPRSPPSSCSPSAVATVVIDGAPFWGADGGGPPAYIPGIAYLVLSILGLRMTWQRVAAHRPRVGRRCSSRVAFLDWLRSPDDRSHLGRFIQSIIEGNALDIVVRKGQQNWTILLGNAPLTLLVPAALLFVIYVLARPTSWGSRGLGKSAEKAPTLRAGLIALVITLTIGFLINDSGTAIPAVGATVAVPLIVSVVVRTLQDDLRAVASDPSRQAVLTSQAHRPAARAGATSCARSSSRPRPRGSCRGRDRACRPSP